MGGYCPRGGGPVPPGDVMDAVEFVLEREVAPLPLSAGEGRRQLDLGEILGALGVAPSPRPFPLRGDLLWSSQGPPPGAPRAHPGLARPGLRKKLFALPLASQSLALTGKTGGEGEGGVGGALGAIGVSPPVELHPLLLPRRFGAAADEVASTSGRRPKAPGATPPAAVMAHAGGCEGSALSPRSTCAHHHGVFRAVLRSLAGSIFLDNSPGTCDKHGIDRAANIVTSIPFFLLAAETYQRSAAGAGGDDVRARHYALSLASAGCASLAFHSCWGAWRPFFRKVDYFAIAACTTALLRAARPRHLPGAPGAPPLGAGPLLAAQQDHRQRAGEGRGGGDTSAHHPISYSVGHPRRGRRRAATGISRFDI